MKYSIISPVLLCGTLLLFCLFLSRCFKENVTNFFDIRVVNIKTNAPIEDAEVSVIGQKLKTDAKGIVRLSVNLDRFLLDRIEVIIDANGYVQYKDNILVGKDQQETIIVKMIPENQLVYNPSPVNVLASEAFKTLEISNLGTDSVACRINKLADWIVLEKTDIVVSPLQPYTLKISTNDSGQNCLQKSSITVSWRTNGKPDTILITKVFPDDTEPTASFSLDPATGPLIQNREFILDARQSSDNCAPDVPLRYRWSFANGVNFSPWTYRPDTAAFYPNTGTYTITLEVRDGGDNTSTATRIVDVQPEPTKPDVSDLVTATDGPELLSAVLKGNLISFGQTFTSVSNYGFVLTTGPDEPTLSNYTRILPLNSGNALGDFEITVENLPPQKLKIRSFAVNALNDPDYSNTIEFTPRVVTFKPIQPICVGAFTAQRGSNNPDAPANEQPGQPVSLNCFFISETEVTNQQYAAFLTNTGSGESEIDLLASGIEKIGNKYRAIPGKERLPVTNITWDGARNFCIWIQGGRLPTEAEWEAAARAGAMGSAWPLFAGTNNPDPGSFAVYNQLEPRNVGEKLPNDWGIFDMSGNVEEWCNDWYGATHHFSTTNPQGPPNGTAKVVRGGAFSDPKERVTVTARLPGIPSERTPKRGFRVARNGN